MNQLIDTFGKLRDSWDTVWTELECMVDNKVDLVDFINKVHQPKKNNKVCSLAELSDAAKTRHDNRFNAIVKRVNDELLSLGQPGFDFDSHGRLKGNPEVTGWMAYNGIQGFAQHDSQARKGFSGEMARIVRASTDDDVQRAEVFALGLDTSAEARKLFAGA